TADVHAYGGAGAGRRRRIRGRILGEVDGEVQAIATLARVGVAGVRATPGDAVREGLEHARGPVLAPAALVTGNTPRQGNLLLVVIRGGGVVIAVRGLVPVDVLDPGGAGRVAGAAVGLDRGGDHLRHRGEGGLPPVGGHEQVVLLDVRQN